VQIHFISGLLRSGSTLLAAILKQNPRFCAGMTSPLGDLVRAVLGQMGPGNEFAVFLDDATRANILRGLFKNYYAVQKDKIIFDTSRGWCSRMALLATLFPSSKVIACVRQVGYVMDSLERISLSRPLEPSAITPPNQMIYARVEAASRHDGTTGFPWGALKEAYYGDHADRLMLLRYETLVSDPQAAIDAVYDFTGEGHFPHDFDNVVFDDAGTREHDRRLGAPDLHKVRPKIEYRPRLPILPPDLFARCQKDNFWEDEPGNVRKVKVI
jgi:sulfotransferase